ncbi:YidB family protein [Lichenihabitans sp. Uapishka_5]|uniref:YidB family protein n=1 Tax=Lichenihabitans sp. Uapishka_5 TaxID=3037302 RepID=UPI0029E82530|nr:YidB family protein [Lichenihabitans sp. Uapishka_5]MDX7951230.1 YidB family protein [Lichenihabitans sp. Uapishka_5]
MGILDSVLGNLLGGASGGTSSPMGAVLSSILGGGGAQQGGMASSGLGGALGGGGLGGLLSQFQNAGLGHVADSWVGNGSNHPVSPDQLQNVFGADRVNDMANQAGMQPGDFLSQLSQHLPAAVNGMTPNGQLPDEGSVSV